MAVIPCFLCGTDLEVRADKNKKPYFICDTCGLQSFVRKENGMLRLEDLLRNLRTRNFEFAKHKKSFFQVCAVLDEIRDLKNETRKRQRQTGFFLTDADTERAIKALKARVNALLSALEKYAKNVSPIAD